MWVRLNFLALLVFTRLRSGFRSDRFCFCCVLGSVCCFSLLSLSPLFLPSPGSPLWLSGPVVATGPLLQVTVAVRPAWLPDLVSGE